MNWLFIGVMAFSVGGCAAGAGQGPMSLFHGDPSVQVVVKTDPSGAKVLLDGRELGLSPVTFHDLSGEKKTFTLELRREGYEPVFRVIPRQWDTMRMTYRLDPVYFYTLAQLPEEKEPIVTSRRGEAKQGAREPFRKIPAGGARWSEVDAIPELRKLDKGRDAVALVIGISKYRDEAIPQVRYAKHDAEIMAAYLEAVGGISRSNIKVLMDEGATSSDLSAYIEEWLPRQVSKDTTVFVYYAGHGTPNPATGKAFLLPYDGHPDFQTKLYPLDRLYEHLERLPAKEVVVMLDSCFSGASGRSVLPAGTRPMVIEIQNPVLLSGKLAILAAATGTQVSSDYDKEQHGLFTYYLLKGLRGEADSDKNGTVEVDELFQYVRSAVTSVASKELNRDQTPLLQPSLEQIGKRGKIHVTVVGG